jgi:hypothetical protein
VPTVSLIVPMLCYGLQSSSSTGNLTGVIRDATSSVIPGATVTVRNLDTNQARRTTSAFDGEYRFVALTAGEYELRVEAAGFLTYVNASVAVVLGRASVLDVLLGPAGVTETIQVTDQPPPIDPTSTAITTTIDPERIEELPINSRNYLEFTLTAPGVAPSNTQTTAGSGGAQGAPLGDSGFTFGGMRPRSNAISIDGLDNTDETTGAARVALSPEIVREFQIINNGPSAESGGAAGGAINVVTKTGSNTFHGDAFLFGQNDWFNAQDSVTARAGTGRPAFHRYQPGIALGGPIRRDRLFFYVAGEQEHLFEDSASEIGLRTRDHINAALAAGYAPGLRVRVLQSSRFPVGSDETEAAGKLTYVTGQNTWNSRFAFTNSRLRGDAFNGEEWNDISARGSSYIKDYQLTGSAVQTLSHRAINELRGQISRRHAATNAQDRLGPEIDIVGGARFGRPFDAETTRREIRSQLVNNVTVDIHRHELKAGIAFNHVGLDSSMADGFGGIFTFRSLDDFLAGRPAQWRQAFGTSTTSFGVSQFGAFIQDRYQPRRGLNLNLGVRYDIESLPGAFRTNYSTISPRLGLAWSPTDSWIVRSAFGLYYDRIPLAFLNRAVQKDGSRSFEQIADDTIALLEFGKTAGARAVSPIPEVAPSISVADPAFTIPYSVQSTFSLEHQISNDVTARVDYLFTRGVHLLRTRNINLLPPIADPSGREIFGPGRIASQFDAIYQLESSASSNYKGVTVSLNKRLSGEFELLASFTRAKALDDASDFDEQPQNPYNLRAEHGASRQDVRNRFAVTSLFDLPIGPDEEQPKLQRPPNLIGKIFGHIEAAPILTLSSGRAVDVLTGIDEEHSHAFPFASRPVGFGRNTARTPAFVNVDLRVVKYIPYGGMRRLDFAAEAFNLLNHANVLAVNPFYGSGETALSTFGTTASLAAARQLRFSLDFEF